MKRPPIEEVPPDAGASYLGAYGLANEWTLWLFKHDAALIALTPKELLHSDIGRRPCPDCSEPMVFRPGQFVCYRHDEPVRTKHVPPAKVLRLYDDGDEPVTDVLFLIGKDRDVEYRDGKWRVVVRKLPRYRKGRK